MKIKWIQIGKERKGNVITETIWILLEWSILKEVNWQPFCSYLSDKKRLWLFPWEKARDLCWHIANLAWSQQTSAVPDGTTTVYTNLRPTFADIFCLHKYRKRSQVNLWIQDSSKPTSMQKKRSSETVWGRKFQLNLSLLNLDDISIGSNFFNVHRATKTSQLTQYKEFLFNHLSEKNKNYTT